MVTIKYQNTENNNISTEWYFKVSNRKLSKICSMSFLYRRRDFERPPSKYGGTRMYDLEEG
jgi:hypothetical protein